VIPDEHIDENAKSEFERAELAARIGCRYVKAGLSPPFHLREAVRHWGGLSHDEIMAVIELHFDAYRRFYTTGTGDRLIHMVRAAIHKAIEAKHPSRDRPDGELDRPLRKRRGRLQPVAHAGGVDVFDDGDDGGPEDDRTVNVERSSGLVGYERVGLSNLEDDAPGETEHERKLSAFDRQGAAMPAVRAAD